MHLDEEWVQRLLDDELDTATAAQTHEHLAACAECRAQVEKSEHEAQQVMALLSTLDRPAPRLDALGIARRARAENRPRGIRWAAGVALAVGLSGAAVALPGSPLRGWLRAAVGWVGGEPGRAPSAPPARLTPEPTAPESVNPTPAGIAVDPGRDLAITFTAARGEVHVSLALVAEVAVRAPAGAAAFTSHVDGLVIDNAAATSTFELTIPQSAPRVEIRLGDRRIFLKDGTNIATAVPAQTDGSYVLPLGPGRP